MLAGFAVSTRATSRDRTALAATAATMHARFWSTKERDELVISYQPRNELLNGEQIEVMLCFRKTGREPLGPSPPRRRSSRGLLSRDGGTNGRPKASSSCTQDHDPPRHRRQAHRSNSCRIAQWRPRWHQCRATSLRRRLRVQVHGQVHGSALLPLALLF
jgi:hypothetical protein